MIGRKSVEKNLKVFLNSMQKISSENSLPL